VRPPIARDGWWFLLPLLGLALIGLAVLPIIGLAFGGLAAFIAYFFRDPERSIPTEPGLLLSPADGKIVSVTQTTQKDGLPPVTLVSIFLSVFDVHINRAPMSGEVVEVRYQPGKFLPAFQAEASARNEQNVITLQSGDVCVVIKQIAGILARRIVCRITVGDRLRAGERFGLIRFGSRMDVLIPATFRVDAQVGQRVRGGESVLAAHIAQPVQSRSSPVVE
jgi:phosphatidylserine decarboxylase